MDHAHDQAKRLVHVPALGLIASGIVGLLGVMANVIWYFTAEFEWQTLPPETPQWMADLIEYGVVFEIVPLSMSLFVLWAALRMRRLEGYGTALAAAIVALIPCTYMCCCLVGPVFGIWAIVVLSKPEVKLAFASAPAAIT